MAKKDDVEAAVFKSLDQAPLSLDEAIALSEQDFQTLSEEYGLCMAETNKVSEWFKQESVRLISQNLMQPGVVQRPGQLAAGVVEEGRSRNSTKKVSIRELNTMILKESKR